MTAERPPSILWFRQDLRLADNPALAAALARGAPILPLYILDEETPGRWAPGGAGRWWLHHSLAALAADLEGLGRPLVLRRGPAERVVAKLAAEVGAGAVFWNRCYEPFAIARDTRIKAALQDRGLIAESSNGALLFEPWVPQTQSGGPFKVFTPFWRHLLGRGSPAAPLPRPEALPGGAYRRLLRGVVGIEIPIARIEGKAKLSQNRTAAERTAQADGLRRSKDPNSQAIAYLMAGLD